MGRNGRRAGCASAWMSPRGTDLKFPHWAAPVTLPVWPSTSARARARSGGTGPGLVAPLSGPPPQWPRRQRLRASNLNSEAAFEVRPGASGMAH